MQRFRPSDFQPPLPTERFIARGDRPEGIEEVPVDALFVGGGPAGLAGAIRLARISKAEPELAGIEIAVLEKAERLGDHCLSGAVVNPGPLRALFPDLKDADFPFRSRVQRDAVYVLTRRRAIRVPTPPVMHNRGNFVCSICELVRWLGERAEELGVNVFTGFPAESLLMEGGAVRGVRTSPRGLGRDGKPTDAYQPPTDVTAKVTVLAEGTRGSLTQAYLSERGIGSTNPQIYALGVKELWEVRSPPDAVIHTMGWPLPRSAFGGSFCYPMGDHLVAIGLVVGLDYREHALDVHDLLQRLKMHPLFRPVLEGGKLVEWGAKTIPEGGFHSIPARLHGDGVLIAGDGAGLVNVAALKGIHYAIESGALAAATIAAALKSGSISASTLASYDEAVRSGMIGTDLHRTRAMRLAFKRGFVRGVIGSGLATVTGGRLPGGVIRTPSDADEWRTITPLPLIQPDGVLTFSKLDANFRSGNATRDDIPLHVIGSEEVPREVAAFYAHLCPAGVYEWDGERLVINPPNCIDCKATDVLGPRWLPREAGSGPRYERM